MERIAKNDKDGASIAALKPESLGVIKNKSSRTATSVQGEGAHSILIENRKLLILSGVEKVVSSSDNLLSLLTTAGGLSINGKNIKIVSFSAEDGSFSAEGEFDSVKYSAPKSPLLKRMFK